MLIPKVLDVMNIHNYGIAFSWLQNVPSWVFALIAAAFAVVVILALRRGMIQGAFGRWMAVLALAGAIGNCIDRVLQSAKLNYADGTSLSCGGMVAAPTVNGEIEVVSYHTMDGVGQTVIDVHELASVTVAGKTYPLPSIIDSQN